MSSSSKSKPRKKSPEEMTEKEARDRAGDLRESEEIARTALWLCYS